MYHARHTRDLSEIPSGNGNQSYQRHELVRSYAQSEASMSVQLSGTTPEFHRLDFGRIEDEDGGDNRETRVAEALKRPRTLICEGAE